MNFLNMPIKSQVCTVNNKRDILDQKIKVKKSVLNFSFRQLLSNYYFIHMAGYKKIWRFIRYIIHVYHANSSVDIVAFPKRPLITVVYP